MATRQVRRCPIRYCSLDLETTSLVPHPDHILMVSMVVEDTDDPKPLETLPHFTRLIWRPEYKGEAYALQMNAWLLEIIAKLDNSLLPCGVWIEPYDKWEAEAIGFLDKTMKTPWDKKIVLAGKNVGTFDLQFLPSKLKEKFHHRVIDIGSMFLDWSAETPPSFSTVKEMVDLPKEIVHDAHEDALDVIRVLRTTYPIVRSPWIITSDLKTFVRTGELLIAEDGSKK